MKFYRILTFAVIAAISASFVACSDDDDDKKFDSTVLPTSIKVTENGDISILALTYEAKVAPKTAGTSATTTRIKSYVENGENNVIEYSLTGNDVIRLTEGNTVYTYEYSVSPKATTPTVRTITKKQGTEILAVYTINSQGLLVSEKDEDGHVTLFEYSGNNITKITGTEPVGKVVDYKASVSYAKNSGIFRNVTTPQWFLITELKYVAMAQTVNNVSKAESIDYEIVDGKTVEEKTAATFTYVWLKGFPTKIDVTSVTTSVDATGKPTETTKTSSTSVTYNVAK